MDSRIENRCRFVATAVCAAALAGACAIDNPRQVRTARADERQCFHASMVNGFTPVGRDTVQVTVGARTVYELKTVGYCPEIDWTHRILVRSTGGSNWICRGFDAELLVPGAMGTGLDRCPVTSIRRLDQEEVQALARRRR